MKCTYVYLQAVTPTGFSMACIRYGLVIYDVMSYMYVWKICMYLHIMSSTLGGNLNMNVCRCLLLPLMMMMVALAKAGRTLCLSKAQKKIHFLSSTLLFLFLTWASTGNDDHDHILIILSTTTTIQPEAKKKREKPTSLVFISSILNKILLLPVGRKEWDRFFPFCWCST